MASSFVCSQVAVEFKGLGGESEREVFQRVQNGIPLTPAEKLQAVASPWVEWVNVLKVCVFKEHTWLLIVQKKYVLEEDGFSALIQWDTARGRDFECLARVCFLIYHVPKHTLPGEKKLHDWLQLTPAPQLEFKQLVHGVFDDFVYIASREEYNMAFTKVCRINFPSHKIHSGADCKTVSGPSVRCDYCLANQAASVSPVGKSVLAQDCNIHAGCRIHLYWQVLLFLC